MLIPRPTTTEKATQGDIQFIAPVVDRAPSCDQWRNPNALSWKGKTATPKVTTSIQSKLTTALMGATTDRKERPISSST